ncbi:TIGR00341 family protein [Natronomonas salina]|uniref:TIGR00341 family protein n=1 Tax=Natronomonas salina TaxID=1710540 RepID=UPI0015B75E70|nr:TIGR00341 family protein [Natronomonas salina]QLD88858.1 TIGR00341 family protein [Natronomonas salina]
MRLLQISVADDRLDAVLEVLRERDLGYSVSEGAAEQSDRTNVSFVLPADAVETVLEDLEEEGFDRGEFTVSVKTEFAHFDKVDEVQNRWGKTPNRLAPAAMRSKAKDLRRNMRSYLWMMILSAVVATAGIFTGSPAIVVGSMVIAPIVSPVLTADVGVVRNDRDMLVESLHMQLVGLVVAVVASAAFAWFARELSIIPTTLSIEQLELMSVRVSPSILALVVGLTAGAAGAYGLATKGQATIVGVMIAAALIPTAAATGIGIAWGNAVVAVGALLLLVISIVGVNAGGALMLLYLDYRPDDVDDGLFTFESARQAAVVLGTILLVVAIVGVAGITFADQHSFERSTNAAISDVVGQEEYGALGVRSTTIQYTAPTFSDRTVVTVVLTKTSGESFPGLSDELAAAIAERTDRDVIVQVQFVDYQRSNVSGSNASAAGA